MFSARAAAVCLPCLPCAADPDAAPDPDPDPEARPAKRKRLACPDCAYTTDHKSNMDAHRRTHTGEKPYKCEVCNKAFAESGNLKKHERTHTGEKPFACKVCNKVFATSGTLYKHERTHTGEKPFACKVCNKVFATSGTLYKHERTHTGEKPYQCSEPGCGKAFAESGALKRHERYRHTSEKPFACKVCNKVFTTSGDLKAHERTHTGIKPYECKVCEMTFMTNNRLKEHERTHTGQRPYACTYAGCEYKAAQFSALQVHERYRHTGERPHVCQEPLCGQAFVTKGDLKEHTKGYHTPEGQQKKKKEEERIEKLLLRNGYTRAAGNDDAGPAPGHFRREFRIDFACLRDGAGRCARIDFVVCPLGATADTLVFLEVDEHQHRFYAGGVGCDLRRVARVQETLALGGLPVGTGAAITWLRYNPHAYKIAEVPQARSRSSREALLVRRIAAAGAAAGGGLSIEYLCFDADAADAVRPAACGDPEYSAALREVARRSEAGEAGTAAAV